MRVLLTGRNGQVGWELERALAPLGDLRATGRRELDHLYIDSIREAIRGFRPDIIVNAAAYTAVDKAESEPELARSINSVAPGVLAEEARRLDSLLVHFSTDYVFDGAKRSPYTEDDPPNPVNVYGRTKLAGEQAIASAQCRALLLRTSWVFSRRGSNFLLKILELAAQGEELRVIDDQVGSPTWSDRIAEATVGILKRSLSGPDALSSGASLFHLSSSGQTSWHGFAKKILEFARSGGLHETVRLSPIGSADFPSKARRPNYSVLSNAKVEAKFGIRMPAWDRDVQACMANVAGGA